MAEILTSLDFLDTCMTKLQSFNLLTIFSTPNAKKSSYNNGL